MPRKLAKKDRNVKLTIEYEGTDFKGWQVQGKGERTIQGAIEDALETIFGKKINLIGAGRTDSGVHAQGQVANFRVKTNLSTKEIKNALNANLPADITVLNTEFVRPHFHAQHKSKSKVYRYTILHRDTRTAQYRNFCMIYPYPLNLRLMRQEAKALIGRKDFKGFAAANPSKKIKQINTVRQIKKVDIKKREDFIYFDIEANGFLYRMVRNIVGTLLEIGNEGLPKGRIEEILKKKDRTLAGDTTQAKGLSLLEVKY